MDEIYQKSANKIRKAKRVAGELIDDMEFEHICSADFCNPENEPAVIRSNCLTDCVYVCKFGQVHICTFQDCNQHVAGICPISGACYGPKGGYSSYDKENPMTWGRDYHTNEIANALSVGVSEKQIQKAKRTKKKTRNLKDTITTIIETLLYSPKRKTVNARKDDDDVRNFKRATQAYLKTCSENREPPCIVTLLMTEHHYLDVRLKLEILEFDETLVAKYLRLILKIYKIVKEYHIEAPKIDILTFGVLYGMRQGYAVNGVMFLPCDSFLLYNLPSINDLPIFGYDKKKISYGTKMVEIAFKKAMDAGASLTEIEYRD